MKIFRSPELFQLNILSLKFLIVNKSNHDDDSEKTERVCLSLELK